jgi:predicted ester cyclase
MRAWFDEVWNQGTDAAIDKFFAPTAIAHGLPGGDLIGPQGFRQVFTAFHGAFPDIHITIERSVSEGDFVAVFCRVTGTHTGPSLGLAPTSRKMAMCGAVFARVSGGQIQEGWNCFDFLTMYQQLGAIPEVPGR